MNRCDFLKRLGVSLSDFIDNRVGNHILWRRISEHIAECEHCQREVEELRQSMEALRGTPELDPGPGFNAAVLNKLDIKAPSESKREAFKFRFAGAFALAAVLLLIALPLYVLKITSFVSKQDVYVIGKETLIPGSTASMRVVVANNGADNPVEGALVRLFLEKHGKRIRLLSGKTNKAGTLDGKFLVPANLSGNYQLIALSQSSIGTDRVAFDVNLKREAKVLLSTDKPVYQPGQTIHIRTLSLLRPSLKPAAGDKVVLTIEDPKGNRVYKKTMTTSRFGVAAVDFQLGDEIGLGAYKVKALLGKTPSEKTVTVKRYVLPKFKVELKTDKTYYMPGETIHGTVTARYFFGKPVDSANVEVVLNALDTNYQNFADVEGRTNSEGIFTFERRLPDNLVGQPLQQGNAQVRIDVGVIDRATHREEIVQTVPVSNDPVNIAVVPESGQLAPGLENIIYVVTSYPDGRPAATTVAVYGAGINSSAETDELGIAAFQVPVPKDKQLELKVKAVDGDGRTSSQMFMVPVGQALSAMVDQYTLDSTGIKDARQLGSILIRTDKSLYSSGDTAKLLILSTRKDSPVYIDAVRDGQTILTKTAYLKNGKVEEEFDLSKDFSGTVTFSAYVLSPLGSPVRDTATVLVREANELSVNVTPDKPVYRPGDTAKLQFRVTDRSGRGVVSAVGLDIVDESVFSVQEQAPGLAALYFALQEDILKPRYQIKEFDPYSPDLYRNPEESARNLQSEILRPKSQASKELPGYIDSNSLFLDDAVNREDSIQRAGKVLFAGAVYAGEGVVRAETAAERERKRETIEREFFGEGMKMLWLLLGPIAFVCFGFAVSSFRHRKLLAFTLSMMPLLFMSAIEVLLLVTSLGGTDWADHISSELGELIILIPLACVIAGCVGAGLAHKNRSFGAAFALFVCWVFWAAIMFPVFARARSAGMAARAQSNMNLAGKSLQLGDPELSVSPDFEPNEPHLYSSPVEESVRSDVVRRYSYLIPGNPAPKPVHVRQFFPETLFSHPEIITDEQGKASLEVPIADSITTWRASAVASSLNGQIGSGTAGIKVFQDFFVDPDLPVSLTTGDSIKVPVAVYNYLQQPQTIDITLRPENWFSIDGPSASQVTLAANEVGVVYFPITVNKFGKHSLTVEARGTSLADAIKREITVWPNGQEQSMVVGGRISGSANANVSIPAYAIPGTSRLLVKVYPGVYSQLVDGLDGLLQAPYGCFEQTSSVTYPNVLVLQYLKAAKKEDPRVTMKAEQFINLGYQRLLGFQVDGGGFDWYGDPPANVVLTAYGIMELADMATVYEVDKRVIERARTWLKSRQRSEGSWEEENYAHTWGQLNSALPVTAYVTWALAEAGYSDADDVLVARDYLLMHLDEARDPYVLALVANALIATDSNKAGSVIGRLADMAQIKGDRARWTSRLDTLTYGSDNVAQTETTALAAYALLKDGSRPELAEKALNELVATRDANGSWSTTQATILALKALVLGSTSSVGGPDSKIEVMVNSKHAGTVDMTGDAAEVTHTINATRLAHSGRNTVHLQARGKGSPAYQVAATYYVPWFRVKRSPSEPVKIDVDYGSTQFNRDAIANLTAKVSTRQPVRMAIVDLGVPPGFRVMTEDLESLKQSRTIDRYELTGRQIILYMRNLTPGKPVTIRCRLRALYPVTVSSPSSRVYDYYNPDKVQGTVKPVVLRVN